MVVTIKQTISLLCLITLGALQGFAKPIKWNPTLSIFESFSIFQNIDILNSGIFENDNRPFNFGIELTQKIPLDSFHFLNLGLRYQTFANSVYALNQIPELNLNARLFYWQYKHFAITIPIHFGKDFYINQQRRGDYYFGLSLGVLHTTSVNVGLNENEINNYKEQLILGLNKGEEKLPYYFFPNLEAGFHYIPFKKIKKLNVGFNASLQLKKTKETHHFALAIVPSKDYDYFYESFNSFRMLNLSLSIGYTF